MTQAAAADATKGQDGSVPVTYGGADDPRIASREAADLQARFFRALGDATRVQLLHLLLASPAGECSVGELVIALGAPQNRISTHLGCLRWCGLVQARRLGKQVLYRVADPRVRELLVLGGAVLRDHAAGVAGCGIVR
ncbi:MAG TPA: metalloregulator ArsR/SmtB family transcription factor [Ktedonobacterales bacterium]